MDGLCVMGDNCGANNSQQSAIRVNINGELTTEMNNNSDKIGGKMML